VDIDIMKKGFTLIELVVSVGVIAIISSALFLNWRPAQGTFALRQAAFQLMGDLRRVQQLSLSTQEFSCVPLPAESHTGFGLYLNSGDSDSYQVFENCNDANYSWDSGEEIETLNFPSGVTIQSFTPSSSGALSIFFVPPDPDTYINDLPSGQEAEITLTNGSLTAIVKVNSSGRIKLE